jgi:5-methylcytosine-specific restriction enzyme A
MRNARAPIFRAPWLPSRAEQLAAFRTEQTRYKPRVAPRAAGYDTDWERLRARHLAEYPDCRMCERLGKETRARMVDHIQPICDAPERRLDPSNLQSLCWPCHNRKTQREVAARRRSGGAGRSQ